MSFRKFLNESHHGRARALVAGIRIAVRQELADEYKLDLTQMYLLMDYFSDVEDLVERVEAGVHFRDDR